jgi:hypothetical protein
MQDYTPHIVDDFFDSSFVGDYIGEQFQEGFLAKPAPCMPMSGYEKLPQREMIGKRISIMEMTSLTSVKDYTSSSKLHDHNAYLTYGESPYEAQVFYGHGLAGQEADFQYVSEDHLKHHSHTAPASRRTSGIVDHDGNFVPALVPDNPRKRKASDPSHYDSAPQQKKPATQLHVQNANNSFYDVSGQTSPYSPFVATPASINSLQPSQPFVPSSRPMGHQYSTSTASQVSLAAPSPHTPSWNSPSFATVKTEPSPPAPMTPVPRPATASPLKSSVPRLVRTSTIQQPSPTVNGVVTSFQTSSFNPYAMYPLKANLKLRGDLDSMTKDWSTEEIDSRRRLVEFKRSQDGSTINADFKPVAPQDRAPSSITISCILWKEKKEYYVTSVDTIYLLEALVGVRFTVEEKNRIRRNLEGFRPATVSKAKTDSEEFFRVIMGFPHPKPRNIEKDVKVFPWKILAHALKKIISKYSASYSSTASAILTPLPSSYASTEHSVEFNYPPSPRAEFHNHAFYNMANGHGYPGSQIPGRMTAPITTAPIPELQLQVPTSGPVYGLGDTYGFGTMPGMPQASMLMTSEAMSAPIRMGPTWDYTHFINDSPASAPPQSAPPMAYHRGPIETADFITPHIYHMR